MLRKILILSALLLNLVACNDDSSVSAGASSTEGDGGKNSAQFAGTYRGSMQINYSGDGVNGNDNFPILLVVNRDGTVALTVENETVKGVIGGDQISVVFRITRTENGAHCEGDAIVLATVKGNALSGPVSGDASCKLVVISREASLSGKISAQKI